MAAKVDLMVSRIGTKWTTSNGAEIGPIRDTIKSTVAVTGIEKIKNAQRKPYSYVENGSAENRGTAP